MSRDPVTAALEAAFAGDSPEARGARVAVLKVVNVADAVENDLELAGEIFNEILTGKPTDRVFLIRLSASALLLSDSLLRASRQIRQSFETLIRLADTPGTEQPTAAGVTNEAEAAQPVPDEPSGSAGDRDDGCPF